MGPKGTVRSAQTYLAAIKLNAFNVDTEQEYRKQLDKHALELQNALPKDGLRGQHWGAARKFLKILLRNCAYNRFLNAVYDLERLEQWMEVQLDKHVYVGLKDAATPKTPTQRSKFPSWAGVIHLTPAASDQYQAFARPVAANKNFARVHLDIHYWKAEPAVVDEGDPSDPIHP